MSSINVRRVIMTPEWAEKLLARNINRKRSLPQERRFADIILSGNWMEDGNPIRVDVNNDVRDGQSRLGGIALAADILISRNADPDGASVPLLLAEGLAPESQLVMDTGRRRNFAHWLQINDIPNSHMVASTTTFLWNYLNDRVSTRTAWGSRREAPQPGLWALFQERRDDIVAAVNYGQSVVNRFRMSNSVLAVAWLILKEVDEEDCEEFFAQLRLESTLEEGSGPALLIRLMSEHNRKRYDQQEQLALLIKAWNLFRDGGRRDFIVWKSGGKRPEKFPVPF